jgi:YVTN family beta-propeller protein
VVANSGDNSVTIFKLATGLGVTITDPSFAKPRWVASTEDGLFAVVTNADDNTMTWINLKNLAILGTTTIDPNPHVHPRGIAIQGDRAVLVADGPGGNDHVKVIDLSCLPDCNPSLTGNQPPGGAQIIADLIIAGEGDKAPEGVAITANGDFALVAYTTRDRIGYVDLRGPIVLLRATTPVGDGPFDVAVTFDDMALVTDRNDDALSIIDVSHLPTVPAAATSTIRTGDLPQGIGILPDESRAVIAQGGRWGQATILNLLGPLSSVTVSLGHHPFGVATSITPHGFKAAITNKGNDTVSILNLTTNRVDATIKVGDKPQGIAITPIQRPAARLSATPRKGPKPLTVTFNAAASTDPDGAVTAFTFDFGDGTSATTTSATVNHTYEADGQYTASLVVTDDDGATSTNSATVNIEVKNQPPTAALSASPPKGKAPLTVTFNAAASTDPDGAVTAFTFDFGDGTLPVTTTSPTVDHIYTTEGEFTAGLVVTDDKGAASTNSATVKIKVKKNKRPKANFVAKPWRGKAPLTVKFTNSSKDQDGTVVAFSWDFGDGTGSTEKDPTHTYTSRGKFRALLSVTDDSGGTSEQPKKTEIRVE